MPSGFEFDEIFNLVEILNFFFIPIDLMPNVYPFDTSCGIFFDLNLFLLRRVCDVEGADVGMSGKGGD